MAAQPTATGDGSNSLLRESSEINGEILAQSGLAAASPGCALLNVQSAKLTAAASAPHAALLPFLLHIL